MDINIEETLYTAKERSRILDKLNNSQFKFNHAEYLADGYLHLFEKMINDRVIASSYTNEEDNTSTFVITCKNVEEIRKNKGIKLEAVCRHLGILESEYNAYFLQNKYIPMKYSMIRLLCAALWCSPVCIIDQKLSFPEYMIYHYGTLVHSSIYEKEEIINKLEAIIKKIGEYKGNNLTINDIVEMLIKEER